MRLLILLPCTLALYAVAAAAQSGFPSPPVATNPKTTLDERLPQHDSRSDLPFLLQRKAAARELAALTMPPALPARSNTCFAMRTYQFTPGPDAIERQSSSLCVPAKSGHVLGAAGSAQR